jgi:hypothetical protein
VSTYAFAAGALAQGRDRRSHLKRLTADGWYRSRCYSSRRRAKQEAWCLIARQRNLTGCWIQYRIVRAPIWMYADGGGWEIQWKAVES